MANSGVAPIADYTLPVSQVRLLIGDTDAANISGGIGTYTFFSDAEIGAVVSMFGTIGAPGSNVKRAAAQLLRTIAFSQVMLLKVFTTDDLESMGDKVSEAIRKNATDLENSAITEDALWNQDFFDYNNYPTIWPMEGGATPINAYTFYERYLPPQAFR